MKNGRFETQKEIFEALIAGKKITLHSWLKGCYWYLTESGSLCDNKNKQGFFFDFRTPSDWLIHPEPKKVTKHYKWLIKGENVILEPATFYKEGETPVNGIKRLDGKFITVDEDGNLKRYWGDVRDECIWEVER